MIRGWLSAAFVIFVWGVTFANTRALLFDFSALEIQLIRFVIAWAALWGMEVVVGGCSHAVRTSRQRGWRDEALFAAMGLCGVFVYQFLENCAIYYKTGPHTRKSSPRSAEGSAPH